MSAYRWRRAFFPLLPSTTRVLPQIIFAFTVTTNKSPTNASQPMRAAPFVRTKKKENGHRRPLSMSFYLPQRLVFVRVREIIESKGRRAAQGGGKKPWAKQRTRPSHFPAALNKPLFVVVSAKYRGASVCSFISSIRVKTQTRAIKEYKMSDKISYRIEDPWCILRFVV